MIINLRDLTETQLLELVMQILAKPEMTGIDKQELTEINMELVRRDTIKLAEHHHPTLKNKTMRRHNASREEQYSRYIDCGPQNWDDRD
jgi:hypothetical protein